jgi:hypothetical protein
MRILILIGLLASISHARETRLAESLPSGTKVNVTVSVQLDGDVTLPGKTGAKPQRLAVTGASKLEYDERALPAEDIETGKLLRIYRKIEIQRTVGDRKQTADIRKEVRRLIVLRTAKAKSPFSPDGPLTWNEIDVVKHDLFAPALASDLLPNKAVKPGDAWTAGPNAVKELTDLGKVTGGDLKITFIGIVQFDGKERARLGLEGVLRGVDDNGPARHTLDGTAYVDLDSSLLSYLSVKGSHELLDGEGTTLGRLDGRFTMTRKLSDTDALSDAAIAKLELKPNGENTRLLYKNDEVQFTYPRRWRVAAEQGKQITLDGPNGAGILLTLETAKTLPTAEAFRKETLAFLAKEKGTVSRETAIRRAKTDRGDLDRFGFDAEMGKDKVRLEYAVLTATSGGATIAARLPLRDADELTKDVEVMQRELKLLK